MSYTVSEVKTFYVTEADNNLFAPGLYAVDCYVEYLNYYDYPTPTPYGYPPFVSFTSKVALYTEPLPNGPTVICWSAREVYYYRSSDTLLRTQSMQWNVDSDSIPSDLLGVFTLSTKPSYVVTGAAFGIPGVAVYDVEIKANFS